MYIRRGVIRNKEFGPRDDGFSSLRYGNITPTDIDAMIEYKNKCYIWIEVKHLNTNLPYGQKLAYERLCDDLQKVKPTLFIVASHDSSDGIIIGNLIVREYRWNGKWKFTVKSKSVKRLIDEFLRYINK